jgi:hypothetical protein
MNNLITKLKLQAGVQDNPDQEGLDLFAELIVQECARLGDCKNSFGHGSREKILKYFGIKELA